MESRLQPAKGARQKSSLPHECGVPTRIGTPHSCGRTLLQKKFVLHSPANASYFSACVRFPISLHSRTPFRLKPGLHTSCVCDQFQSCQMTYLTLTLRRIT